MVMVEAGPLLLTVKATAALIGISERRTWHLIETGRLPSYKVGGRRYVPRMAALSYVAWLTEEGEQE